MSLFYNNHKIEEGIKFLVDSICSTGHNPKPVILHSIRVALFLYNLKYPEKIILAALLHDLIEDSEVSFNNIRSKFCAEIADLVSALSFDSDIKDREKRFADQLDKVMKYGKEALIIRASDFIDNSNYYHLAEDKELRLWLVKKMKIFIDRSKKHLEKEPFWKELLNQYGKVKVLRK